MACNHVDDIVKYGLIYDDSRGYCEDCHVARLHKKRKGVTMCHLCNKEPAEYYPTYATNYYKYTSLLDKMLVASSIVVIVSTGIELYNSIKSKVSKK